MFGYKLIKTEEYEKLKSNLADANGIIESQTAHIADLNNKIEGLEKVIATLNETATVKNDHVEEKPVKKVRRKSSKKTTKKEE
jgi:hypothetical protein